MTDNNNSVADIHKFAVVHPNAKLGKNVKIGPFAVIGENVEIDDGTEVGPSVVITGWTKIGRDCHIFQGASVGEEPQDLKFKGERSFVEIGDRTRIHEFCTIHRACGEDQVTRIGNDCLLMAYVHVAHNCVLGNNVVMANAAMIAGHVVIEDKAVVGGMAGVHQFVRIGRNAMVGGMSRNVHDIVPFTLVEGSPAAACGLNTVGMSRSGVTPEARKKIKQAYRIIFRSGLRLEDAVKAIEDEIEPCEEIEHMITFLKNVDRGICRPTPKHGSRESDEAED